MAAAPILALQQIRLTLGSTQLLENAELSLLPGEKVALVGRNGSGKSTLLKIAAGQIESDGGRRFLQPGATRTLVLYAHYDGQPVDASKWTTPPWQPVLRTAEPQAGGTVIPIPTGSGRVNAESRIYGRGAGDDKGSIQAILSALDAMKASQMAPSVNLKVFFEGEE